MKFLTDENIAPGIVHELRKGKHDVFDIKEKHLRGITDIEVAKSQLQKNELLLH